MNRTTGHARILAVVAVVFVSDNNKGCLTQWQPALALVRVSSETYSGAPTIFRTWLMCRRRSSFRRWHAD
jgi:hypothetical protein